MSKAEFDAWSDDYEKALDDALGITGFDAAHFVRYKLTTLKRLLPRFADRPFELLDYGCGPGNLRAHLQETFPRARYTGVDPSLKMIERARDRFPDGAEFHTLDAEAWKDSSYDLVFAAGVFHHIPHAEHSRIVRQLRGLLAAQGVLAIWEHNPLNPFTRKIVRDCAFDRGAVLVQPKTLGRTLSEAGFDRVDLKYVTFFPRPMRALIPLEAYLGSLPVGGQYVVCAQSGVV